MLLASTYADILTDLVMPLGGPFTHILHAMALFVVAMGAVIGLSSVLTWRTVARLSKSVPVGPTVGAIVEELAARFGVRPVVRITGGVLGADITSLVSAGRPTVLLPASRLIEAKTNPPAFRFRLAHELAHLAANDYRSDVWITSAYLVGGLFMVGAFCRVLWNVVGSLIVGGGFGADGVWFALRGVALPLATNTVALGSLAALLFLEHRAAMRLREFLADAVAASVSGANSGAFAGMASARLSAPLRWLYSLVNEHPHASTRTMALAERQAAFRADLVTVVIQGFFAATVIEMALQLLLVGSSVDVSSLAERQVHLLAQLTRYPEMVWGIIGSAIALCAVANFLVIRRLNMLQTRNGHTLATFFQTSLLYALGSILALLSSQTFLWEISEANWNLAAWIAQDPERPVIYLAGIFGFAFAAFLARLIWSKGTSPTPTSLAVCLLPSLLQLSTAAWFLVPAQLN
ncbi:M48 family metalloprotease [Aquibium sp. ELW1220]|uniref:M48 family metalloprotease n=1 Tax=Aquibium sp. ELW1220 TaxID=2976766 RepID=UPI0025B1EFE4|nr:M48 family metalloprotease [Aquibium sp. ELW1220]MDN2583767.1 M48 family metalloprotease [Aquibium sp. ELW1220]